MPWWINTKRVDEITIEPNSWLLLRLQKFQGIMSTQGVVTLIGPIEPFATGIKMKSSDQEAI